MADTTLYSDTYHPLGVLNTKIAPMLAVKVIPYLNARSYIFGY
jgi:hypothetical protein